VTDDFDWDRFQREAAQHIRNGVGEQHRVERVFQFLILTSFDSVVGWEVLKRHKRKSEAAVSFAVRSEWDRRSDWARLEECKKIQPPVARPRALKALMPTFHQRTVNIDSLALDGFLTDLNEIRIPPYPFEFPLGLGGTGYRLAFGRFFLSAEYQWWEDGPAAWRPLIERVGSFIDWLERQPSQASAEA
jgi:hypothetical protein